METIANCICTELAVDVTFATTVFPFM
jgi:hypothetical protein